MGCNWSCDDRVVTHKYVYMLDIVLSIGGCVLINILRLQLNVRIFKCINPYRV